MALFSNFKWYDWIFSPSAVVKMTQNLANDTGVNKALFGKDLNWFGPSSADEASSAAKLEQQSALDRAEQREDTAVQRRVADLQAAGINPIFAGSSMGAADSGASQAAVYSQTQQQQAQAQQTQALASLLSSAAMLFMTKGRGIPVVNGTGSSAKSTTYVNHAYYIKR